jgi:hypothetical protein
MKYFSILYNSLLWTLVISITCFKSEWLEMRVNIGHVLFAVWLILFTAISLLSRKKTAKFGFSFSAINLVICLIYSLLLYGIGRLAVVPASIIREGLHLTNIGFSCINVVLFVFLLAGICFLFVENFHKE